MTTSTYSHQAKAEIRAQIFTPGTRVQIERWTMENSSVDESHHVPPGTQGEVSHVDGIGTVHVNWDNGVSLGAVTEDHLRIIATPENIF